MLSHPATSPHPPNTIASNSGDKGYNGQNPYTQVKLDICQANKEAATEKWYFLSF